MATDLGLAFNTFHVHQEVWLPDIGLKILWIDWDFEQLCFLLLEEKGSIMNVLKDFDE